MTKAKPSIKKATKTRLGKNIAPELNFTLLNNHGFPIPLGDRIYTKKKYNAFYKLLCEDDKTRMPTEKFEGILKEISERVFLAKESVERGLKLFVKKHVKYRDRCLDDMNLSFTLKILSEDRTKTYIVTIFERYRADIGNKERVLQPSLTLYTCTCPDHVHWKARGGGWSVICKHIFAVMCAIVSYPFYNAGEFSKPGESEKETIQRVEQKLFKISTFLLEAISTLEPSEIIELSTKIKLDAYVNAADKWDKLRELAPDPELGVPFVDVNPTETLKNLYASKCTSIINGLLGFDFLHEPQKLLERKLNAYNKHLLKELGDLRAELKLKFLKSESIARGLKVQTTFENFYNILAKGTLWKRYDELKQSWNYIEHQRKSLFNYTLGFDGFLPAETLMLDTILKKEQLCMTKIMDYIENSKETKEGIPIKKELWQELICLKIEFYKWFDYYSRLYLLSLEELSSKSTQKDIKIIRKLLTEAKDGISSEKVLKENAVKRAEILKQILERKMLLGLYLT